jgi:hypothetical protein
MLDAIAIHIDLNLRYNNNTIDPPQTKAKIMLNPMSVQWVRAPAWYGNNNAASSTLTTIDHLNKVQHHQTELLVYSGCLWPGSVWKVISINCHHLPQ